MGTFGSNLVNKSGNTEIMIKKNLVIPTTSWKAVNSDFLSTTEYNNIVNKGGKFMADIDVIGVTDSWIANIKVDYYGSNLLIDDNLSYNGKIRLYSKVAPEKDITLLSIVLNKEVV